MVFGNGVKNIQAAYNGARTVVPYCTHLIFLITGQLTRGAFVMK